MKRLRTLYYKLDAFQQSLWVQATLSVVIIVACALLFGMLVQTSRSIDQERVILIEAFTGQNLQQRDELATALVQTGSVVINGIEYGGQHVVARAREFFGPDGNITDPRAIASLLIRDRIPAWAPGWLLDQPATTVMLGVTVTLWLLCIVWIGLTIPFLLTATATLALVSLSWFLGSKDGMWLFGGFGTLIFTFVMLSRLILLILDRPNQICAVAHTVIKEASRTRLALVFIVALVVLLPLLPIFLDADQPLRFRVQTFISRSMTVTYVIAAFLTLVLATSTVAFEVRDRQIWQLVTKPVSRLSYLIGKWLGVMLVNLVIMLVAGLSIFMYTQYLRTQPVAPGVEGQLDAVEVRDAVLTARIARRPDYVQLTPEQLRERVEQEIQRDPDLAVMEQVPPERRRLIAEQVNGAFQLAQRTIPSGSSADYYFSGLQEARAHQSALMLRYQFYIMDSSTHDVYEAAFMVNDRHDTIVQRRYIPTMKHELLIGPNLVQEDGTLKVSILNMFQPPPGSPFGQMQFDEANLEVFFKAGSFEANFIRATLIAWIKLSFIAMLGIAFATFLSFPVAVLAAFTLFIAGTVTPYLAGSLEEFGLIHIRDLDWTNIGMVIQWFFRATIGTVGQGIVFALGWFGRYSPTSALVDGRYVPWSDVIGAFVRLIIIWSGFILMFGWLVMRKRELATYSGQG